MSFVLSAQADDLAALKQRLEKQFKDLKITQLNPTPLPGLYEMVYGTHIAFVSADGRFMLNGQLIDIEKQTNITAERRSGLLKSAIEAVGEDNMIVFAPDKTKRTITVFTDVDCPYCARLHREVPELNRGGVKVRYLMFPRAGLNSDSYRRAVAVWCSKDRKQAIGVAKSGGALEMKTCANPVEQHFRLGQDIGIEGTPAMVLDDGQIIPGYVPAATLLSELGLQDGKKAATVR